MYFADLTNYSYFHYENSKNIGWLDGAFPLPKGKVSDEFITITKLYSECKENVDAIVELDLE